jgi:repressor LexA
MPPDPRPLTEKQRAVLAALVALKERDGWTPSMRELAEAAGTSSSNIHYTITALARKGYVRRAYHKARSIEVLAPAPAPGDGTADDVQGAPV